MLWEVAGRPDAEEAIGKTQARASGEVCSALCQGALPRFAAGVRIDQRVVNDGVIAGAHLDGGYISVLGEVGR